MEVRSLGKEFWVQRPMAEALRNPRGRDLRMALEGVDLTVARGEFFGLLGQNGAGKTTLFKILSTLVQPDSGSARVCGFDVLAEPARVRERLTPVIPNERSLYWRISATENLRLYASLYGLSGADARGQIEEILSLVGLEETGTKQVGLFSSGMKQRLLIGRALLGKPEVLLLDEPTRSMDPVSARDFRRFLKHQVGGVRKTTVLLATHDHEEVTDLCSRVAVLDRGKLLGVGTTEALLANSALRRCAIWTDQPDHPSIQREVDAIGGTVLESQPMPLTAGSTWHRVLIEIPTDELGAGALLAALSSQGVTISRFTREDLSLADLLERVRQGEGLHPSIEGRKP